MTTQSVARVLTLLVAAVLVVVPFHAFLTVWMSSLFGHYTLLRLWKEAFLLLALVLVALILWRNSPLRRQIWQSWLGKLILAYLALQVVWGVWVVVFGNVSARAAFYGLLLDSRFLLFFGVSFVATSTCGWLWRQRFRLLLGPAGVVVFFGLLQQFVLPYDFLKHFGYGPDTIRPYQTIDKKTSYIRVLSTMRGANPLGAYLIIILTTLFARGRLAAQKLPWLAAIFATAIVLYGTGSRSAWLGAVITLGIVVGLMIGVRHIKWLLIGGLVALVLFGGTVVLLRDNDFVQNTLFHTDENSQSASSSNSDHFTASYRALKQVVHEPLGRGPGSAGPASVYNTEANPRIAENYYLQIAQEFGWLGLGVFIAILVLVARALYDHRHDPLALALFASFIGLACVNLLQHAWADDSLAYIWWGMAGIALSGRVIASKKVAKA